MVQELPEVRISYKKEGLRALVSLSYFIFVVQPLFSNIGKKLCLFFGKRKIESVDQKQPGIIECRVSN